MTSERWSQIQGLFLQAIELPPAEREKFLIAVCKDDEFLRRELNSLLACDIPDTPLVNNSFLSANGGRGTTSVSDPVMHMTGRRIGAYRLVRLLGRGGMGSVHLAVRDDDHYKKEVAIKLLKRGMDTDVMLQRFRQERQILANLEHPFIARLIDGGATDDGLPYFVMEYVDGLAITKYCAEQILDITERLRLFCLVCEAVQYAHQHLVIHRDLKPGNILITKEGIPKLLDFGIAKLIKPEQTAETALMTHSDLRLMTPDYASPEQFRGESISTSSDVYSLGAVLYEVLTGQRPYHLQPGSLADMEKAVCDLDPEKPSLAAGERLRRQLSGDLDKIVLTAMRKEPQRRYASAAEFSEDLRRHMEALPILAQEDRWAYRAGKFVRRNRLAVGAALLVFASLIGGIVTTTFHARRAERRFQVARQLAKAVVANVKGPLERLPGSTAARASMIQTVIRYLDGLAEDPGQDPGFELEIADAYREIANVEAHPYRQNLGQTVAALSHYQKAIAIFERHTNRVETRVRALEGLIGANIEAGDVETRSGNAAAASARLQRMFSIASEAAARDSTAVSLDTWTYLYFRLGAAESRRGAAEQALIHFRRALEVSKTRAATERSVDARSTLRGAYINVANAQKESGDLYGARENSLTALRASDEAMLQPDATVFERSMLAGAHQTIGTLLGNPDDLNLGDRPGAISHYRAALDIFEAIAASDRHDFRARDDLSGMYLSFGAILLEDQPAEALKSYQKATAISEELSKAEPPNTKYRHSLAFGHMGIGECLHRLGKSSEALPKLLAALEIMKSLTAPAPDQISWIGEIGRIHRGIGNALLAGSDEKGAQENFRQALATTEELLRRAPSSLYFQRHRADVLECIGRYYATLAARRPELKAEARSWFQKSLAIWQDWTKRKVAAPYAARRESQAAAYVASCTQP